MRNDLDDFADLDGFDTFEDGFEGEDQQRGSLLQGTNKLKFTNEATWLDTNGDEVPPDRRLIAVDNVRTALKWGKDNKPVEIIVLGPYQKFPNIAEWNEAIPRSEWIDGLNGLRGPWQAQHVLFAIDLETMDRFSFPTSTIGGIRAVSELVHRIKWMRKFRGQHVYPIITLSDTFMPTKYGGRQRPFFDVKEWIRLGGDQSTLPPTANAALEKLSISDTPAPQTPAAPVPAQAERQAQTPSKTQAQAGTKKPTLAQTASKTAGLQIVEEPSLDEQMNDEVSFDQGGAGESGRKAAAPPSQDSNLIEEILAETPRRND
jgi:hypothetical protein